MTTFKGQTNCLQVEAPDETLTGAYVLKPTAFMDMLAAIALTGSLYIADVMGKE